MDVRPRHDFFIGVGNLYTVLKKAIFDNKKMIYTPELFETMKSIFCVRKADVVYYAMVKNKKINYLKQILRFTLCL